MPQRLFVGLFVFGIIGLFTVIGVLTPGIGWFIYVFLIPFWAIFPMIVIGVRPTLYVLGAVHHRLPDREAADARAGVVQEGRARAEDLGKHVDRRLHDDDELLVFG
jgi:hypothetical protein